MKKRYLLILLFLNISFLRAQRIDNKSIIGIWKVDKSQTENRDNTENGTNGIIWYPMVTDNGTGFPDVTFQANGEFIQYYTSQNIDYGKWKIKNHKVILFIRITKQKIELKNELFKKWLKRGLIIKKDGCYYQKPMEQNFKFISDDLIKIGEVIYKRAK